MSKTELLMNKPMYLGLSILELSKILMYEFWYDYVKPKYGENAKHCFIVHVKQILFTKILQKVLKQDLTLQILN